MDNEELENQDGSAENPISQPSTKLPIQDGQIPQDSNDVETGSADALGLENIEVSFKEGNYAQFQALPMTISQKVTALTKTLVPLIEVALIELTGSSSQYNRNSALITPSFDQNGNMLVNFNLVYNVPGYIGVDFEYKDLQDDSSYIYNRITPAGIKITKCEIDTASGDITINGEF